MKAISIRPDLISKSRELCFEALKSSYDEEIQNTKNKRYVFLYSLSDFKEMLSIAGSAIMKRRNETGRFVIDSDNEALITELYYYITQNPSFSGNLNKGLLILGRIGCGKTILLEAYCRVYNTPILTIPLNYPTIKICKSADIHRIIQDKGLQSISKCPLFLDDLGREQKTIVEWGSVFNPLVSLLNERYTQASNTHATSNFTLATLSQESYYGATVGSRISSMFNVLLLPGNSRRQ